MVDEKRESSQASIADEVVKDAEEADQELSEPSELVKMQPQIDFFKGTVEYLKHMNDLAAHKTLLHKVQMHLWKKKKLDLANSKLKLLHKLLAD